MASSRAADEGTLLKAILQESTTEVMVFDADTLRIVQANPAATKNLHYQPRALQKLTPLDFLPPEDRQAFHTLLTLLRHGKSAAPRSASTAAAGTGPCIPPRSGCCTRPTTKTGFRLDRQ